MRAIDVMTSEVVSVSPEARIDAALRLLLGHRVSGLPVVEPGGRVVGMLSEGDLLRRVGTGGGSPRRRWRDLFRPHSRQAADYVKAHAGKVEDVMTREIVAVEELTGIAEIADLLESRHIKRVPVVRDGRLVGIVSRADLLRALASGGAAAADANSDRAIRDRLLDELRRQRWAKPAEANIVVSDGVVHLWGAVGSETARAALRVAAENTEGVRAVEDHTMAKGHYLI